MASKPGKWSFLKDKFPKMPIDADYQAKVDSILDSVAPMEILDPSEADMSLMVRHLSDSQIQQLYLKCRNRIDTLTAELSSLTLEEEAYCRLFNDRFEDAGEISKTFNDGVTISISVEPYPTVKDKVALDGWLEKKKLTILKTLNYQTLASLVKERLEGKVNEALPDGVDVFMKNKLSCRGRNK